MPPKRSHRTASDESTKTSKRSRLCERKSTEWEEVDMEAIGYDSSDEICISSKLAVLITNDEEVQDFQLPSDIKNYVDHHDELLNWSCKQLQARCKELGLSKGGTKAEMAARIVLNVDVATQLKWERKDISKRLPPFRGPSGPACAHNRSWGRPRRRAVDFFSLLVTTEMIQLFVVETNRYARQCRCTCNCDCTCECDDTCQVQYPAAKPQCTCKRKCSCPCECECSCTGIYRERRLCKCSCPCDQTFSTDAREIKAFIGLMIWMGWKDLPQTRMYFSTDEFIGVPAISSRWTRRRFAALVRYFHVADNEQAHCQDTLCKDPAHDKLHKLRPFLDMLQEALRSQWHLRRGNAIDEVIVPFKGQTRMKAYIPSKKHKWGIKVWKACDAQSGYMWGFLIYTGADGGNQSISTNLPDDAGVPWNTGERVVLHFLPQLRKGCIVFIDNYFTSVRLLLELLKRGVYATGTLNVWTRFFPRVMLDAWKKVKTSARGTFDWAMSPPGIMVLIWNDNAPKASPKKCVAFASTAMGPTCQQTVERWVRRVPTPTHIKHPDVGKQYNANYGGVDRNNRGAAMYAISRATGKWWWAVFWHLIDSSIHSAWALKYPNGAGNDRKKQQLQFRIDLAKQLTGEYCCRKRTSATPVGVGVRYDGLAGHWPDREHYGSGNDRCACGCGKRTRSMCEKCQVYLGQFCYKRYHTPP